MKRIVTCQKENNNTNFLRYYFEFLSIKWIHPLVIFVYQYEDEEMTKNLRWIVWKSLSQTNLISIWFTSMGRNKRKRMILLLIARFIL